MKAEALEVTIIVPESSTPAWSIEEGIREFVAFRGANVLRTLIRDATTQEANCAPGSG